MAIDPPPIGGSIALQTPMKPVEHTMSPPSHQVISNLENSENSDLSCSSNSSVKRSSNRHPTPLAVVQLRRVAVPAPPNKNVVKPAAIRSETPTESSTRMLKSSRFDTPLDENALADLGTPQSSLDFHAQSTPSFRASDSAIDRLVSLDPVDNVLSNGPTSELFNLDSANTVDLDRRDPTKVGSKVQSDLLPQRAMRRSFEEEGEEIYFVTRGGIDQGPYTIATLEKMVDVGTLSSAQVLTRVANNQEMLAVDHPILRDRFEANMSSPPSVLQGGNRFVSATTGQVTLSQHRAWSTMGWIFASTFVYAVIAWVLWMRSTG